jgi:hypothetical protein
MATGILLIIAIIIFGLLTVLSIIFSIIYFANSKKGKFIWLAAFFVSLIALILSIYFLTNSIVNKISSVTQSFENSILNASSNPYNEADTAVYSAHEPADLLNNQQVLFLKSLEPEKSKNNVISQFYSYLGFGDYYRLPIRYPFSIHCNDSLGLGSLFNEGEVNRFDESNNGEIDCGVNNIVEFTFDEKCFLAKIQEKDNGKKSKYLLYFFEDEKFEEFADLNKLILRANSLKFSQAIKFTNSKEYFNSFY